MELLIVLFIVLLAFTLLVRHGIRSMRRDQSPCCGCSTCSLPEELKEQCASAQKADPKSALPLGTSRMVQGDRS
ncbi:MAG TPA: hypothetical protein PLZ53_08015 [Candidatus Hydrogenedentes bacterium]|nr:hypothetical protein [Candidatus Hydrogenedentota bacterium]